MPAAPISAKLIVISAPSGAGKTTLLRRLLAACPDLVYSVSCTTRAPRGTERDGEAYNFLDRETFERKLREGAFLEHAEVHGAFYGTLRSTVVEALRAGRSIVMDIDVQGAAQVRAAVRAAPADDPLHDALLDIFIEPPSLAALRARLEARGEDTPEQIATRLRNAEAELRERGRFRHRIVNDALDRAAAELIRLVSGQ
jgi:guanylate kinase